MIADVLHLIILLVHYLIDFGDFLNIFQYKRMYFYVIISLNYIGYCGMGGSKLPVYEVCDLIFKLLLLKVLMLLKEG